LPVFCLSATLPENSCNYRQGDYSLNNSLTIRGTPARRHVKCYSCPYFCCQWCG